MSAEQDAGQLLDRLDVRHPCDLDLLMFFARHPRTLLSSGRLALFTGYELNQIAESLEILLNAGFLARTPNSNNTARMYVFSSEGPDAESLPSLVQLMSTRDGRLAARLALTRRLVEGASGPVRPRGVVRTELASHRVTRQPEPQKIDEARTSEPRRGGE